MIKFIFESGDSKELSFGDVDQDQFFINDEGFLCQKINYRKYNVLANGAGEPYCFTVEFEDVIVRKILPRVIKIKWE
jgi:hypothetical protein